MDVMRDLRYLQVDPMRVVAPNHVLVLWSRLGRYDLSDIDKLLWEERLIINAVYAEPNTPRSKDTGQAVADAIEELGVFLSAKGVCYTPHAPLEWKSILH